MYISVINGRIYTLTLIEDASSLSTNAADTADYIFFKSRIHRPKPKGSGWPKKAQLCHLGHCGVYSPLRRWAVSLSCAP